MRSFNRNWRQYNKTRQQTGKRSGLEVAVASQLDSLGIAYEYEKEKIQYRVEEEKYYTPDFKLPNGIFIETKGEFTSGDRKKHLRVKEQYPAVDIRFVFSNPNQKIAKGSTTTYAMWCEKNGFKYAKGAIPKEWLAR